MLYNVSVRVIALVEAPTPEAAYDRLRRALSSDGFVPSDDPMPDGAAFVSEDQTVAPDLRWKPWQP